MTTEQKLPEWWDTFCEAVKTRTLDKYECFHTSWCEGDVWIKVGSAISSIYESPNKWQFRKKQRTVNINGVELVAPVQAGEIQNPSTTIVFPLETSSHDFASEFIPPTFCFLSQADRDAMRNALLGVKP